VVMFRDTAEGRTLHRLEAERIQCASLPRHHCLTKRLIVNVTSHLKRFSTIHLTLECLLNQTIIPDEIILWIAKEDIKSLPARVNEFRSTISIIPCENLYSYKKLVPAVQLDPDAYHVTADDDVYYPFRWLEQLVDRARHSVCCTFYHFGFRIAWSGADIMSYRHWIPDTYSSNILTKGNSILPIGVGGIMYPPHCFHPDMTNKSLFLTLAPFSDDLWFFAMTRLTNHSPMKVGPDFEQISWPGTQNSSLWGDKAFLRNDSAVKALIRRYGVRIFESGSGRYA
jgi:hypothetical protein